MRDHIDNVRASIPIVLCLLLLLAQPVYDYWTTKTIHVTPPDVLGTIINITSSSTAEIHQFYIMLETLLTHSESSSSNIMMTNLVAHSDLWN